MGLKCKFFLSAASFQLLFAQMALSAPYSDAPRIAFANVEKGRSLLTANDDFVVRLSPFDRSARLKTNQRVSREEYLRFVSRSALAWTAEDRALIEASWSDLIPKLSSLSLPLPKTIYFVKTSGKEEGGQEYTRGATIVLPQSALDKTRVKALKGTIAHELFHILSRNAPEIRQKLYAVIGFLPCEEITFPPALADRKLTDPDAPKNDHYIRLRANGKDVLAVPILYANAGSYDTERGGEFFQYLEVRFLLVNRQNSSFPNVVSYEQAHPTLLALDQVSNFYEQVGKNTSYIIHPEEILADNFKFLVLGTPNLPSPEIIQELLSALK